MNTARFLSSGRKCFTAGLLLLSCAQGQQRRAALQGAVNPLGLTPAAVEAGQNTFRQVCSSCHGPNGEGGQGEGHGPNLVNSWEVRRAGDTQLFGFIHNGVPGTAMPAFSLPQQKLWELVAFVRSLNSPAASVPVSGNVEAGETLFWGKGDCGSCHKIRGRGGYLGPDLTNAGEANRVEQIREEILQPVMSPHSGYRAVILHTSKGDSRGVAKNYSDWSADILDENGQLHLIHGPEMKQVSFQNKSWMPSDYARKLSAAETQDLVAFLSRQSLRSTSPVPAVKPGALSPAGVTNGDLLKGEPGQNWLTYLGDYSAQRHSSLTEINGKNVSRLTSKWVYHIDDNRDLETTPVVYDGVMYATGSNAVYALNAVTGRSIWTYHAEAVRRASANRGVAIFRNDIFLVTGDCHVVALDRESGAALWDREYAPPHSGYSCTGAPLVVKDKIIVGVASEGKTCFVAALSIDNGAELWRFWAVPRPGEPGSDTWGKFPLDEGGGPTWTTGTYDPRLNLLYWPTGNPWPDFYGGDRPGDNLYSDSVLALDADSGKLKWYFQSTPHDTHDWDANETPVLLDTTFQGRSRKLLIQANRNGYYYVLDRTNGEFLLATPFVQKLNWATGVDSKGRPIAAPNMDPSPAGTRVCPSVHGATNWWAPSLDPDLNLFYVVSLEQCEIFYSSAQQPVPVSGFRGTGHTDTQFVRGLSQPGDSGEFFLRALEVQTGKLAWEFPMPGPTTMWAGTVSTQGGLVFSADDEGDLVALDAKTGKDLWHFDTGSKLHASPITFAVDAKQYVTIASGTNLFTFGLP